MLRMIAAGLRRRAGGFVRNSYLARRLTRPRGWPADPRSWVTGNLRVELSGRGRVAVYLLGFDNETNRLVQKKMLGVLTAERDGLELACRVHPDADRFDLALYALAGEPATMNVVDLTLRQEPMPQEYSALDNRTHE